MSETPVVPPPPKPTQWKVIIPVAIVVILCCICLVVVGVLAYMGTQGTGPLSMLATATLTPTLTPTKTLTPTPEITIAGDWELYYSWDCSSYNGPAMASFYADNTYLLSEGGSATGYGTWYLAGDYIDFIFDDYPNAHYVGSLDYTGAYMEGTMDTADGSNGCWYAYKP
jgi:hypothetical protein